MLLVIEGKIERVMEKFKSSDILGYLIISKTLIIFLIDSIGCKFNEGVDIEDIEDIESTKILSSGKISKLDLDLDGGETIKS